MFKRRKTEGFEWREYVRTTILVRRKERRQRIEDVKVAAVEGLKDASLKGLEAGAKGAASATETLAELARRLGRGCVAAVRGTGPFLVATSLRLGQLVDDGKHGLRNLVVPLLGAPLAPARRPGALLALKMAALAICLLASLRALQFGLDGDTQAALWIAAVLAVAYALLRISDPDPATEIPSISAKLGHLLEAIPGLDGMSARARGGTALALVAASISGALIWTHAPFGAPWSGPGSNLSTASIDKTTSSALEGRATAITGSMIKLAGETLMLDGIEAPEMDQICRRPGGSWRCGEAAKQELADRLRGKRITCARVGTTPEGIARVTCETAGEDIAKALVIKGVVFSEGGMFASYGDAAAAAKEKRLGLWAGENERPGDYRAKRWEEAKKQAPEGCPIKGRVRSGTRTYVLPWSPSYDTVRINTNKGERWFCSEDEAIAAGWQKSASL